MTSDNDVYTWYVAWFTYRNKYDVKGLLDIAGITHHVLSQMTTYVWNGRKRVGMSSASCVFIRVALSDVIMLKMMKEISVLLDVKGEPICLSDMEMDAFFQELDDAVEQENVVLQLIMKKSAANLGLL